MTEGIVNILKPPGMTSSDAVADVRHIFKIKRVGHTGTLDPGAAGVLPICIGRATRLFDILVDKQKEYIAEVTFGAATDTQDAYGRIVETDARIISKDELAAVLPYFIGQIEQTAPMYSAVSIDGKRLYQLAREGADAVEIKRSATIDNIELMAQSGENRYLLLPRNICKDAVRGYWQAARHMRLYELSAAHAQRGVYNRQHLFHSRAKADEGKRAAWRRRDKHRGFTQRADR